MRVWAVAVFMVACASASAPDWTMKPSPVVVGLAPPNPAVSLTPPGEVSGQFFIGADEAWKLLAYLSSDEYQLGLIKVGLWLPSHTSLLTPEGIASWMTEGVHPTGYDKIVTEFAAKYGHSLFYPPGYAEANDIVTAALDPVWIGEKTAQEALVDSGALGELDTHLQEQKALIANI